jgi:hypothetical protein
MTVFTEHRLLNWVHDVKVMFAASMLILLCSCLSALQISDKKSEYNRSKSVMEGVEFET